MSIDSGASQKQKKNFLKGLLGGGKTYFVFAIVAAVLGAYGALTILGQAAATTTYYVLGQDVAARTQITPDMLQPVITSDGGQPRNALDPALVDAEPTFAKFALRAGDILTESNAGKLERINKDLPEGMVVASFMAPPENAVAGKIRKGDYIDLFAVDSDSAGAAAAGDVAKLVLQHVLVLDVTVNPSTIAQAATDEAVGDDLNPGPESAQVRGGIPALYTVALSPNDAAKLALVRGSDLMVVLSPNGEVTDADVQVGKVDVFAPGAVGNSGAGTEVAADAAADGVAADPSAEAPATDPNAAPADGAVDDSAGSTD